MKRANRKQRRYKVFGRQKVVKGSDSTRFKVISKSGAVVTLIQIELAPKRQKRLSVGDATLDKVR